MNGPLWRTCAGVGLVCCASAVAGLAWAEEQGEKTPAPLPIAATVNGEPIYVAEVEVTTAAIAKRRQLTAKVLEKTKAEVLRQLIHKRLAAVALKREGTYASDAAVEKEVEKVNYRAKEQRLTLERYAAKSGVSVETLRYEVFWRLAWEKYLERHLADALEGYFKAHHKDLDGTQIRASHILLRPDRFNETEKQRIERAEKIRQDIESGKMTFEQAVAEYSAGPSRQRGGDLGFFPRYGEMVEEFAKAAFALEKDAISKPVNTTFGTHLIRVTDIKPGTRQWTEVLTQIKTPASVDLFEKIIEQEREGAEIEFTGMTPYLKPGTDELVLPEAAGKSAGS
jgi:parvulin-like peptidyl-prolyl isomerase